MGIEAENIAKRARAAGNVLKTVADKERSALLVAIHDALAGAEAEIRAANVEDLKKAEESGLAGPLVKRLDLFRGDKFPVMLQGILDVAQLEDPVGKVRLARELDEGLCLYQVTAPVGALLVIFESRPEVIANITALAIKSANAAILKGGKESTQTFRAMARVVNDTISKWEPKTGIPPGSIQLIETRQDVADLLSQDRYIDLVVPRGSNALVRQIKDSTKIPVLGHADGICSIYVDEYADVAKAKRIVLDSKSNYPAACNAMETLLINPRSPKWIEVVQALTEEADVVLHATPEVRAVLQEALPKNLYQSHVVEADESQDFDKEYSALECAIKFVNSTDDAIVHINTHSSKHTDGIVTEDKKNAEKFMKGVDSAGVYWNASTRFADGFRYGFGAEVGISTSKIHARGPVGLDGLVCYQYQIRGNGQVAADYQGSGGERTFTHKDLDVAKVQI